MRINVYTEELLGNEPNSTNDPRIAEIVTAEYISSRTEEKMKNYGVRIYLKSPVDLHYIPGRDDDRSAVTFWCGDKEKNCFDFLETIKRLSYETTLDIWHKKTEAQQKEAEKNL